MGDGHDLGMCAKIVWGLVGVRGDVLVNQERTSKQGQLSNAIPILRFCAMGPNKGTSCMFCEPRTAAPRKRSVYDTN